MKISQISSASCSFGALICKNKAADKRQQKILSTLSLDRKYFSRNLLRKLQQNDIDIVASPCKDGFLNIALQQNAGKISFIPQDNNDYYMVENFDSDDVFVFDYIKDYAKKCETFLNERMYDNPKNKKKKEICLNIKA